MSLSRYSPLLLLVAVSVIAFCSGEVQLQHLSTLYLPFSYRPIPQYVYGKDVAEQSAYDPDKKILYTVGNELLHAIDMSDVTNPHIVFYTTLRGGELTDIETCGDYVAVAFDDKIDPLEGKVVVFRGLDQTRHAMEKLHSITVGALPDMVKFTSDCQKIVVVLEGELRMVDGEVVDPEGGVGIITFLGGDPSTPPSLKIANFTKFNSRADEYIAKGVRWVYHGDGTGRTTTFSQDLEPEYVTLNWDETRAFITLQENNAVAAVDIINGEILEIYPLGPKSWRGLALDGSDKDEEINLDFYDINGLYQPDTLKYVTIGGNGYILTANEGEEKEYSRQDFPFYFNDARPGRHLVENGLLDEGVSPNLRAALADDSRLGRLSFSAIDGIDSRSQKIRHPHTYGGRGFSLWDPSDLSLLYDSGDEVERRVAQHFPEVFSSDCTQGGPEISADKRSKKKGPETETLDVGKVNNKTVLFVANERPGIILIYTFPNNNITTPHFESAHYAGGHGGGTWEELYSQRRTRDTDPEDIRFLDASTSPNGQPLLIVSGTTSGTVSLYTVVDTEAKAPGGIPAGSLDHLAVFEGLSVTTIL